jgi:hypothetical protein
MKLKFLLFAVLSFYCFNSFSQNNSKLSQNNNDNSFLGGCQSIEVHLDYTVFPPADSVKQHLIGTDTIFVSGFDSIVFNANWDGSDCGPIQQAVWYKDNIVIDSTYYSGPFTASIFKTVQQDGNYHVKLTRFVGGIMTRWTDHVIIINTNSTTSINNQTYSGLNVTVINNKVIVKGLLVKDNLLLSIYDLTGRIVFTTEIIHPSASFEMEMPQLYNGLYVFNIGNRNFNFLKKFNINK